MHTVYVLRSGKDGNLYVGCTGNIEKRIVQHQRGQVRATKGRLPVNLVYKEENDDLYEAYRKERFYKTAKGKLELKKKFE